MRPVRRSSSGLPSAAGTSPVPYCRLMRRPHEGQTVRADVLISSSGYRGHHGGVLIVLAGLPGTGKTTLARRLAAEMSAAVVQLDAIEAAIIRSGELQPPLGPVGYLVAQDVVAGCLAVGTTVVVDAVSPVAEARTGWRTAAAAAGAPVHVFEVVLADPGEHRRRVEQRLSDLDGLVVPTWEQVQAREYRSWNVHRDGDRMIVDGSDTEAAMAAIRVRLGLPPPPAHR